MMTVWARMPVTILTSPAVQDACRNLVLFSLRESKIPGIGKAILAVYCGIATWIWCKLKPAVRYTDFKNFKLSEFYVTILHTVTIMVWRMRGWSSGNNSIGAILSFHLQKIRVEPGKGHHHLVGKSIVPVEQILLFLLAAFLSTQMYVIAESDWSTQRFICLPPSRANTSTKKNPTYSTHQKF